MNLEQARYNMIQQQIRPWNVSDQDVLNLLEIIKRENFVPPAYQNIAFADLEIPLPCGQHMLSPKIEARILQALQLKPHESILEIGTGSGYMAALLSYLSQHVLTIEIHAELAALAQENLLKNTISKVSVVMGDGAQGWPQQAPYDVIVVSGGLPVLPPTLLTQLKPGGRLCTFVGTAPVMQAQLITCVDKNEYQSEVLFETWAPPLVNAIEAPRFSF